MATKVSPIVEINFLPASSIGKRTHAPLIIADTFGGTLIPGLGDGRGVTGGDFTALDRLNPTIRDEWFAQPAYSSPPTNCTYVRFGTDGIVRYGTSTGGSSDELSGWMISPREVMLDAKIFGDPNNAAFDNAGGTSITDINFDTIEGEFRTVLTPFAPRCSRIQNTGSSSVARARSRGDVPANRQLCFDASFAAQSTGGKPAFRFSWGNGAYAIAMYHRQHISIEKNISGNMTALRTLDEAPVADLVRGTYSFRVMRIAGFLVIAINGVTYYVRENAAAGGDASQVDNSVSASWPKGRLNIVCRDVRAIVGVGVIKLSDEGGTPFVATFGREKPRSLAIAGNTDSIKAQWAGWAWDGTSIEIPVVVVPGSVSYTVTLRANADGIDSPFVSKVNIYVSGAYTAPVAVPLNVRRAAKSLTVQMPNPPSQPGACATLELDRVKLEKMPNWQNYVKKYNPIEIYASWRYDDGTTDTKYALFKGYAMDFFPVAGGKNDHRVRIQFQDDLALLQKPHGFIDHRYPPGDIFFAKYISDGLLNRYGEFYGYMLIKEIIRIARGQYEANAMQAYFPASHYPLLSYASDRCGYMNVEQALGSNGGPPSSGSFLLPAPYWSAPLDWIMDIAKKDAAIFYYGWAAGDSGLDWPRFLYGRWVELIKNRPTHVVRDAKLATGQENDLLQSVEVEDRAFKGINRILSRSSPPGADLPFTPGVRMAESRLEEYAPLDPERASESWERTYGISSDLAYVGDPGMGGVEFLARSVMQQIAGVKRKIPSFTFSGKGRVAWGDLITPIISSDPALGINGQTFRIEAASHNIDFMETGPFAWKTITSQRPLATGGL